VRDISYEHLPYIYEAPYPQLELSIRASAQWLGAHLGTHMGIGMGVFEVHTMALLSTKKSALSLNSIISIWATEF
jgi:hypothetical protein